KAYTKAPTESVLHKETQISEQEIEGITLKLSPEEHDGIIEDLFGVMMERGVKNALNVVARMNNPHLEDDFHRFLVQYLASHYEIPNLRPKSDLGKSLNLRMYEIVLPNNKSDDGNRDFKQTIALMEQFMAGMQSVARDPKNSDRNFYTLELALAEGTDDMSMYVTVPKEQGDLFEKQLLGLFELVRITEVYDDYNIFSYSGICSASYGVASHHDVLQIKTADDFSQDPINVLVNAFSKLESAGEGA